jgi:hypothetical protein
MRKLKTQRPLPLTRNTNEVDPACLGRRGKWDRAMHRMEDKGPDTFLPRERSVQRIYQEAHVS